LKLFGDFSRKTVWKLAEIGGFWVVFEHPHFQAKKRGRKVKGKNLKIFKKIATKTQKGA